MKVINIVQKCNFSNNFVLVLKVQLLVLLVKKMVLYYFRIIVMGALILAWLLKLWSFSETSDVSHNTVLNVSPH